MRAIWRLTPTLAALTCVGLVSVAEAGPGFRGRTTSRGPDAYRHDIQFNDGYTYNDYWGGNIVDAGRGWVAITCRGVAIRVRITDGSPRLRIGERIRVVPFRQDGREAIAELRLADHGFQPVAEGSYNSSRVGAKRTNDGVYVPAHSYENRGDAGFAIDRRGNTYRTNHFYNEGYGKKQPRTSARLGRGRRSR